MILLRPIRAFIREAQRTRRERLTLREQRSMRKALRDGFMEQERLLLIRMDATQGFREARKVKVATLREQEPGDEGGIDFTAFDLTEIWQEVIERTLSGMENGSQQPITTAFQRGARAMASDLGVDIAFDLANPRAVAYLENRGAELIRGINETTRREVQRIIGNGLRQGTPYGELRQQLRAKFSQFHTPQPQLHIRDRAELIAVQEMGEAYEQGSLDMARELRDLGEQVEKSLLTAEDARVDALCAVDAAAGWIPLERAYPSGRIRPPIHPACRCTNLIRRATNV